MGLFALYMPPPPLFFASSVPPAGVGGAVGTRLPCWSTRFLLGSSLPQVGGGGGRRSWNQPVGVRLLPPSGCAVVASIMRCPLPPLFRLAAFVACGLTAVPTRRFPILSPRTFDAMMGACVLFAALCTYSCGCDSAAGLFCPVVQGGGTGPKKKLVGSYTNIHPGRISSGAGHCGSAFARTTWLGQSGQTRLRSRLQQ
jgi:hypothetical protein